jgi:hypothetical protein
MPASRFYVTAEVGREIQEETAPCGKRIRVRWIELQRSQEMLIEVF